MLCCRCHDSMFTFGAPHPFALLAQPTAAQAPQPVQLSCFSIGQPVLRPAAGINLSDEMSNAATSGDVSKVQQLLAAGQDINAASSHDETALHLAAEHGHANIVALLLNKGAKLNTTCRAMSKSVLQNALHGTSPGCAEVVKQLVMAGADINCFDKFFQRETALHIAVQLDSVDKVAALLSRAAGLQSTLRNSCGVTPLFAAACSTAPNAAAILQALIQAVTMDNHNPPATKQAQPESAAVNSTQTAGNAQPDMHPASPTCVQAGTSSLTVQHPRHALNEQDKAGDTILHLAIATGKTECVRALAEAGAALDILNKAGTSALHQATKAAVTSPNGQAMLQSLLNAGADVSMVDADGKTPLHLATESTRQHDRVTEVVQLLLSAGADPAAACATGSKATALHHATRGGHLGAVQLLLAAGAPPGAADAGGLTPLHWAFLMPAPLCSEDTYGTDFEDAQHNSAAEAEALVKLLLDAGALHSPMGSASLTTKVEKGPLHLAAEVGYAGAVQQLLAAGADACAISGDGNPPLFCAVLGTCNNDDCVAVMQLLLDAGASACSVDMAGDPILYKAASRSRTLAVQLLLSAGADAQQQNRSGAIPLHAALQSQRHGFLADSRCVNNVVQQLLPLSDVEAQLQPSGDRPLHLAVGANNAPAVQQLLAAGADPTAVRLNPADGFYEWRGCNTVMELAAMWGSVEVIQLVLDACVAAGQPCPVNLQVLQKTMQQPWRFSRLDQASNVSVLRHLLSYWHKQQQQQSQQPLGILEVAQLKDAILNQASYDKVLCGEHMAALLCYLGSREPHTAGQLSSGGECDLQTVWKSVSKGAAHAPRHGGSLDFSSLGLGMLRVWSADTAAATQQHKALLTHEKKLGGLRIRLSCLALMLGASKKAQSLSESDSKAAGQTAASAAGQCD